MFVDATFRMGINEIRETRDWRKIDELLKIPGLVNSGGVDEALAIIERKLEEYPDLEVLYLWKGYALAQSGKVTHARRVYLQGITNARSKIFLCSNIADLEYELGDLKKAVCWWIRSCIIQLADPPRLEHARPFMMLAYVAENLGESEIASKLFTLCDRIQNIRLNAQGKSNCFRLTKDQEDVSVRYALRLFYKQYIDSPPQPETNRNASGVQRTYEVEERLEEWVDDIRRIGKSGNKPVWIGIGLFALVTVTSLLFGDTEYFPIICFGGVALVLVSVIGFYFGWAKPGKEKAIRELVRDIQNSIEDAGWSKSGIVADLVSRLPGHPVCKSVVRKIDQEEADRVLARYRQSLQVQSVQTSAGISAKVAFQEIPASGDILRIACPICGEENETVAYSFLDNERVTRTGRATQISRPPSNLVIAVATAGIGFVCGLFYFGDVALACSSALVFVIGAGILFREIVVSIVASLLSRKEDVPILLFECETCNSLIPIASNGNVFLRGGFQASHS
jgi:tetratricopeptide (TPR) repeat protein